MTQPTTSLRLEVATPKASYRIEDDTVPIRVMLFNDGDEPVTVNARFAVSGEAGPGEVALEVHAPSGEVLPFAARVNIGQPMAEDFTVVSPHCFVGKQVDLLDYFHVDAAGTYELTAVYDNRWSGDGAPPAAWTGKLRSPASAFEIV
ncbi:MAG TPA: hypothetical protein VM324_04685 [Egibacteraceae bacterium]|nr:hypothetical protein [Egibacteraceae bacterium]